MSVRPTPPASPNQEPLPTGSQATPPRVITYGDQLFEDKGSSLFVCFIVVAFIAAGFFIEGRSILWVGAGLILLWFLLGPANREKRQVRENSEDAYAEWLASQRRAQRTTLRQQDQSAQQNNQSA